MCGISAIIKPDIDPNSKAIALMVERLAHRGPDANGYVRLAGCHLGHNRLSIVDLSTGDQPMSDITRRYWITFNGEIYNYQELREELLGKGYLFKTKSDTEVIISAYQEWEFACLQHFRGMFAFALWDTETRRLFAARDIVGQKPFYYSILGDGSTVLASEIKAILASNFVTPRLSLISVDAYLALGYVPPHKTIYDNVQVLPPGYFLIWENSKVKTYRYWAPRFNNYSFSLDEAAGRLSYLLKQAVRRQMVADVPIGAFLSGGLDSSTIVALAQQHLHHPIKTFSVGFGKYINELPYARLVAKKNNTEHYEIDLGEPDISELFERMVSIYDEPFADSSNIPTYLISEYARRYVKVVLSGDGGDELLGGYCWYPKLQMSEQVSGSWAKWVILRLISRLLKDKSDKLCVYSVATGLAYKCPDIWSRLIVFNKYISYEDRRTLWAGRYKDIPSFVPDGHYFPSADISGLNRAFYFDITSYLPGDILVKVDRATMANGLESRMPFLDEDFLEFALSLPVNLKVNNTQTKIILRQAMWQYWPSQLINRKKEGFNVPVNIWLKTPEMQALARRIFSKKSPLRQLLPGLRATDSSLCRYRTWILITLGVWLRYHGISVSQ